MSRTVLLGILCAVSLNAQFLWKCDPKDGKFVTSFEKNGKPFYCWDGQIFSETKGYAPPPAYVLRYWEEVHRHSQEIRDDIARKSQELKEQVEKGRQNTQRLNQERAQAPTAIPKNQIVTVAAPSAPPPPASRAKAGEVRNGMDRVEVEALLGKPHASMALPGDDSLVEVLNYTLERGFARISIEKGKVASVKISD